MTISVTPVLRSRNISGGEFGLGDKAPVASTFIWRYPRWIHAEGRTHRVIKILESMDIAFSTPSVMESEDLSRNAASGRAIPIKRMIEDVMGDPAIPIWWGKKQPGMQAFEETDAVVDVGALARVVDPDWKGQILMSREGAWLFGRDMMAALAQAFDEAGYHKQVPNRLLEPFSHITVLVTATRWNNFLALRDHADAEPHIKELARLLKVELDRTDNIQDLKEGQWHLPFVDEADFDRMNWAPDETQQDQAIRLSTARAASTSYKTVEGFDMTQEVADKIHDKLLSSVPLHASPAEHVLQADDYDVFRGWASPEKHGNLDGFCQYRKMLPGENQE